MHLCTVFWTSRGLGGVNPVICCVSSDNFFPLKTMSINKPVSTTYKIHGYINFHVNFHEFSAFHGDIGTRRIALAHKLTFSFEVQYSSFSCCRIRWFWHAVSERGGPFQYWILLLPEIEGKKLERWRWTSLWKKNTTRWNPRVCDRKCYPCTFTRSPASCKQASKILGNTETSELNVHSCTKK